MPWKWVKGYKGLYQVCTDGRVARILKTRLNRLLKPAPDGRGYVKVTLCKNGVKKNFRVHYLVATHFNERDIADIKRWQINHIDGDPFNNNCNNLEWCSPAENTLHAHRVLKRGNDSKGENNPSAKLKAQDVRDIRSLYEHNLMSMGGICDRYNISHQHVSDIINRKKWKHI